MWTENHSNKHNRLRSFLKFAGVDVSKVLPPTPKYGETLPTVYTPEEIRSILEDADAYMRLVLELGLKCASEIGKSCISNGQIFIGVIAFSVLRANTIGISLLRIQSSATYQCPRMF
jgi:integrase